MNLPRTLAKQVYLSFTHLVGRLSGQYYFEDYVRVYPDQLRYNRFGFQKRVCEADLRNYRKHRRFYEFAAQFVRNKAVADVGCGSGYGCELLSQRGPRNLCGCDISRNAIAFAKKRYSTLAQFTKQGISDLRDYHDSSFDVVVCSEVLEHIKEYNLEEKALVELKRITSQGGLLVVGTPNTELLPTHGFSFEEIRSLFSAHFDDVCVFENALLPFGELAQTWQRRLAEGNIGVIVTQTLNLDETPLAEGSIPVLKTGQAPGRYKFCDLDIDTTLLYNPHSWVIVAKKR